MRIDLYKTGAKSPKETIGYEHTSKGKLMISRMEGWRADMKSAWKKQRQKLPRQMTEHYIGKMSNKWKFFQEERTKEKDMTIFSGGWWRLDNRTWNYR